MERNRTVIQRSIEGLIRAYQLSLSPLLPPSCRFYPNCSEYAIQAVRIHGAWRGSALAAKRLCRCHPWNQGGYDPVPGSQAHSPDLKS